MFKNEKLWDAGEGSTLQKSLIFQISLMQLLKQILGKAMIQKCKPAWTSISNFYKTSWMWTKK